MGSPWQAIVYIDGLNLDGSALKGSSYKWLDLMSMAKALMPAIVKVIEQGHEVGVFSPSNTVSRHLKRSANWSRPLRPNIFDRHQLPDTVHDGQSKFECPNVWKPAK